MIEICCGSYQDALSAYKAGAKRIELNCALEIGGLTPSVSSLKLVKQNCDLDVICMVRPRGAGFCYTDLEYEQAKLEAIDLLEAGADGLSFGFLNEDRTIDLERTSEFCGLCHEYEAEAVFNRAYDVSVSDRLFEDVYETSVARLIECGVDRILTSGKASCAHKGSDHLEELMTMHSYDINIVGACGITPSNLAELVRYTKLYQVHGSCKKYLTDNTTASDEVTYDMNIEGHPNSYQVVDGRIVELLIQTALDIDSDLVDEGWEV